MDRAVAVGVVVLFTLAASAACPPSAKIPSDWKTVTNDSGDLELKMPRSLKLAPQDKFRFVHGGDAWEDEQTTVTLTYGHWAEYSFEGREGERCRVKIDDANVFVIVSATSVLAWYNRGSGSMEPVVSVSVKDEADFAKVAAIASSLRRK